MDWRELTLNDSRYNEEPIKDVQVIWKDDSISRYISREITIMPPGIIVHNGGSMTIINSEMTKEIAIEEREGTEQ